ncbi:hypothetical protein EON80_28805 [bacterium]|nr:MAG: hypothetical protein EON80_28805 [bacterium]
MELNDALEAFDPVAKVFDELGIEYQLGGSVVSSIHGFPRGTLDVDVQADIQEHHVKPLVERLENDWMITTAMVREAIRYRSSFNILPFEAIAKIDIFVPKNTPFDLSAISRRMKDVAMVDGTTIPYFIDSLEDAILRKLQWYRMGGHVADQKWLDVLGMIKTHVFDLEIDYLEHWAPQLGVADLLDKALEESGFSE